MKKKCSAQMFIETENNHLYTIRYLVDSDEFQIRLNDDSEWYRADGALPPEIGTCWKCTFYKGFHHVTLTTSRIRAISTDPDYENKFKKRISHPDNQWIDIMDIFPNKQDK